MSFLFKTSAGFYTLIDAKENNDEVLWSGYECLDTHRQVIEAGFV